MNISIAPRWQSGLCRTAILSGLLISASFVAHAHEHKADALPQNESAQSAVPHHEAPDCPISQADPYIIEYDTFALEADGTSPVSVRECQTAAAEIDTAARPKRQGYKPSATTALD